MKYKPIEIEIANYIYDKPDKKRYEVLSHFVAKLKRSQRTIERYYAKALIYNTQRKKEKQKIISDTEKEVIKEEAKKNILSRLEALEIISSIARGNARKIVLPKYDQTDLMKMPYEKRQIAKLETTTEYEIPSDRDRLAAVKELRALEGWEKDEEIESYLDSVEILDKEGFEKIQKKYKELLG